jgi:hypothetical protein
MRNFIIQILHNGVLALSPKVDDEYGGTWVITRPRLLKFENWLLDHYV